VVPAAYGFFGLRPEIAVTGSWLVRPTEEQREDGLGTGKRHPGNGFD
jgi:hypothetical protein